jgi:hypothetical protein
MKQTTVSRSGKTLSMYEWARREFFNLEPGQSIVMNMAPKELNKFRDSIYKLTKRYKAYQKMYKTRFLNPTTLKVWRIK